MRFIKNIFFALISFTRDERWAITILAVASLSVVSIRLISKSSLGKRIQIDTISSVNTTSKNQKDTLFKFDPNTVTTDELQLLGFSKKQALAIDNYRRAGAKFKTANDFGRSFVVSDSMLLRLTPYMLFPKENNRQKSTLKTYLKTDINKADSATLCSIKGIGPIISNRIIKYRKLLGGFHSITQIKEVYGVSNEIIEKLNEKFFADTAEIQKIDINFAAEKILRQHPYVNKHLADRVLKIRESKGGWNNITEMKNDEILLPEEARLLSPYLVFHRSNE